MKNTKFVVVQDDATAHKLIAAGFQLVSHINSTYTFVNQPPAHFNFDEVDVKKMIYTNILSL